jgi:diguanylate cyclase (GGDEF)-like protein
MKILVADDDPTSRLIAQTALQTLGHRCRLATDGAQAWDAIQSWRPDAVISDWMMPEMSGLQLCQAIRADPAGQYTYFIMITSQGALEEILEGMNAGADDYLVKPLDTDDLQTRLIAADRVTSLHDQLMSQQTELEVLNHELAAIARRDPLTGLGNRRALDEDLALLEARVSRYGHRYCMALLDVDRFKSYNDTYGHQAGDGILEAVAAQLTAEVRAGDALYRFGGDEFLCIFPEQSLASGYLAVQRMRSGFEQLGIANADDPPSVVTFSAGLAILDPVRARTPNDVLNEADKALYRAKQLGRNRVEKSPVHTA